jgi:hypothetical protein
MHGLKSEVSAGCVGVVWRGLWPGVRPTVHTLIDPDDTPSVNVNLKKK